MARLSDQSAGPAEDPAPKVAPGTHEWSWMSTPGEGDTAAGNAAPQPSAPAAGLADHGERWLGRVGVAFVVLAFGFFFRYAFDQGWIGPGLRLVLGLAAGSLMLAIGLRLEGSRERYSQYLLGGAIAVYYLVGYASYELYELVPFALAFAFMCVTTVLAFLLAERQRLTSLAVIGASGGLSTPFLVSTGVANVPALVAYTLVLLAGAGTVQFQRGWRTLLLVLGFGGLSVMALGVEFAAAPPVTVERAALVIGILVAWALFGATPLLRAQLHRLNPDAWPVPTVEGRWAQVVPPARITLLLLRVGCVMGAFIAVLELGALFSVERATFGPMFGVGSIVYLVFAWRLAETRLALNASAETASILLVLAFTLGFFDYRVMLPLAVTAAGMHQAHHRWGLPGVSVLAHLLFAQLGLMILARVDVLGISAASSFSPRELGALGAIILALTSTFVFEAALARRVYRIGAHVVFLAWLATQFRPFDFGQELISLSWGIYGIALLLLSLKPGRKGVQLAGLATLGLVAAKLLLVDMAQVDVIWRILLFMGFGAAFLGLSYLIKRADKSD